MGGVYFDGQFIIRPQAKVAINEAGLSPATLATDNVLMMFGISTGGGKPKTVVPYSDPTAASKALRSGDLLTAMLAAWSPSPALPGATLIRSVRVNPAVQATLILNISGPASGLTLTSQDYGAYTNGIQVKVTAGSVSGKMITIQLASDNITEVYDNLASVAAAVAAINSTVSGSNLVTAAFNAEGTLANISFTSLASGSDGTTTNTDWTNAFNLIDPNASDVYEAVSSDSSVWALLDAQVLLTSNRTYPGLAVYGHALGLTAAQVMALQAPYASDYRAVIVTPGIIKFNSAGTQTAMASYLSAAPQLAGLICGLPIPRPATFKILSGLGLETNYSNSPGGDLDALEVSGIVALQNVANKGIRIVHGQTTWTADLNPGFREISVRRIADNLSVSLKDQLEAFVGEEGTVFTIAAVKAKVDEIMQLAQDANLITPGVDNAGNAVPAWGNVIVRFNSATGVCSVTLLANPVTPVNYVLVTASFQAVNIVA